MKSHPISFHFYTIEVFFFENGKKNGGEDEMATVLPIFIKIDYVNCKFSQKRVRKNDKLFYKTDFSIDLFRFLFAKCQKNGRRRCCQSASVAKYGTKNWKHLQSKKKNGSSALIGRNRSSTGYLRCCCCCCCCCCCWP